MNFTPIQQQVLHWGNGQAITSGDTAPDGADDIEFGVALSNTGMATHIFTITNSGNLPLSLTGNPLVAPTGSGTFTVSQQPDSSVAAGSITTFDIAYNPTAAGTHTATVSIANNDNDETPYTFVLRGEGSTIAVATTVGIARLGAADVRLTWLGNVNNCSYDLLRSTEPYNGFSFYAGMFSVFTMI